MTQAYHVDKCYSLVLYSFKKRDIVFIFIIAGNIMLEATHEGVIQTRIIDFGLAKPLDSEDGHRGFRTDIIEVIRKFTALYLDQEFDSQTDVRKNWKEKLSEV